MRRVKRTTILVAFRHMTCGCRLDKQEDYLLVCPMHLHAYHMLQQLKRLQQLNLEPVLRGHVGHVIDMAEGRC